MLTFSNPQKFDNHVSLYVANSQFDFRPTSKPLRWLGVTIIFHTYSTILNSQNLAKEMTPLLTSAIARNRSKHRQLYGMARQSERQNL